MNSGAEANQWGPPQGAPMGMLQGPNGQLNAPPLNIAMGAPNMMQGYQGWGTSPQQQSFGYGTPSAPGSYQGWGAPPGPQGPPPHQWGNNYATQQTQGYGSYGNDTLSPPRNFPNLRLCSSQSLQICTIQPLDQVEHLVVATGMPGMYRKTVQELEGQV